MSGIGAYVDFEKKVRDMSGLLPRYVAELAIAWVLDEALKVYGPETEEMVEFNEIYSNMKIKMRGCEVATLSWAENSTPLYFVARAGIDACVAESRELSASNADKNEKTAMARLLIRTARFVQVCSQTALGLSYELSGNRARSDCRRFQDLHNEAESLALIGASYIT